MATAGLTAPQRASRLESALAIVRRIRARRKQMAEGEWREEDHPRSPAGSPDGGQFASAGAPGSTLPGFKLGDPVKTQADIDDFNRQTAMIHEAHTNVAAELAHQFNFPVAQVHIDETEARITALGGTWQEAGHWDPQTGDITLRPTFFFGTPDQARAGMFAHEVMHARFGPVLNHYSAEVTRAFSDDFDARQRAKAAGYADWQDKGPYFDRNGVIRTDSQEMQSKFPTLAALGQYLGDPQILETEDGFTPYSKAWWDRYKQNGVVMSAWSPLHETLAEISRVLVMKTKERPSPFYAKLYNMVLKEADRLGAKGTLPTLAEASSPDGEKGRNSENAQVVYVDSQFRPTTAKLATMARIIEADGTGRWAVKA